MCFRLLTAINKNEIAFHIWQARNDETSDERAMECLLMVVSVQRIHQMSLLNEGPNVPQNLGPILEIPTINIIQTALVWTYLHSKTHSTCHKSHSQ